MDKKVAKEADKKDEKADKKDEKKDKTKEEADKKDETDTEADKTDKKADKTDKKADKTDKKAKKITLKRSTKAQVGCKGAGRKSGGTVAVNARPGGPSCTVLGGALQTSHHLLT
jgi:hypothetical protein